METKINKDWLKQRQEYIQKQRELNSKYISLKNGENVIKIDMNILPIEDKNGKYGAKQVYTTCSMKGDKPLLLSASIILDALIIKALSKGINPFTLIKLGEGKETRYAIKELEE
jgi:hypothetical protein